MFWNSIPIRFQDADFEHAFAWCWSPLEGRSLRWVPYGMPRLNQNLKNMVFFLYGISPSTGKRVGPVGTGFFVGVKGKGSWYVRHTYAVTCWHVAVQGASIIRINTRDGKSRFIELEPHDWQFIPQGGDLCAVDVTERLVSDDETSYVIPGLLVTKDFIAHEELGIGEDGFMLGLFAEQPGIHRNMIAARFGNVSLLASDDAPIEQPNKQKRPSHIFDMRSRPGFSGSPVFVYRTPSGDLRFSTERGRDKSFKRQIQRPSGALGRGGNYLHVIDHSLSNDAKDDLETQANTFLALLGVHASQFPEKVEASKERLIQAEHDDIVREGDKLKVPSSMTVVIPAWEITTLLNLPIFEAARAKRDELMQNEEADKNIPQPEAATDASGALPDDANPNHLEDFNRLVDVAARKRPQGDQP